MRIATWFVSFLLGCCLGGPLIAQSGGDGDLEFAAGREGVVALLQYILSAEKKEITELTYQLEPSREEYEQIFEAPYDRLVWRYHKRLRRYADVRVHPILKNQTEFLLWSATTEELQLYEGEARNFPGGYREMAVYMKPGITFYRFKFVEPGRKLGSAFDVLIYIEGHWRLFHRPWAVLVE